MIIICTLQLEHHRKWTASKFWDLRPPAALPNIHHCYRLHLFYFIFKKYLFIYLAVPGLSCGMRDLVPWPGIEPGPPALGAWSLNHWTIKEVPDFFIFKHIWWVYAYPPTHTHTRRWSYTPHSVLYFFPPLNVSYSSFQQYI